MRLPLPAAVLLLLAGAVAVAIVPVGVGLDARVTSEMRRVAVADLGRAPMILEDRNAAQIEALSMHAMTVAGTAGLETALLDGRPDVAEDLARGAAAEHGEEPVVISATGLPIVGPPPSDSEMVALRRDRVWAGYVWYSGMPRAVGLAAVGNGSAWAGAAGSMTTLGEELAATLSGLARADVTLLGTDESVVVSTLDTATAVALARAVTEGPSTPESEKVDAVTIGPDEYWTAEGELPGAGRVVFSRSVAEELAALPGIRRSYAFAGFIALLLALSVGGVAAVLTTRPVRALAVAADRVTAGDFNAPVPGSRVRELERLGAAFRAMRNALRHRLTELAEANEALEERQQKLTALQAELIRQDRLASSARMVAELAHEIRNPVANVRNCLEVVRRRLADDEEGARFTDMAIDELLRMHELTEGLLDLHRPAPEGEAECDAAKVAGQVAALARVGGHPVSVRVDASSDGTPLAAIPPDALKQILLNLVLNAGEAGDGDATVDVVVSRRNGTVQVDVIDDGPGIPEEVLDRLFDPFFTTKGGVTGVGLGLFIAEGLTRRYGGRLEGTNRTECSGAHFTIELPAADPSPRREERRT